MAFLATGFITGALVMSRGFQTCPTLALAAKRFGSGCWIGCPVSSCLRGSLAPGSDGARALCEALAAVWCSKTSLLGRFLPIFLLQGEPGCGRVGVRGGLAGEGAGVREAKTPVPPQVQQFRACSPPSDEQGTGLASRPSVAPSLHRKRGLGVPAQRRLALRLQLPALQPSRAKLQI